MMKNLSEIKIKWDIPNYDIRKRVKREFAFGDDEENSFLVELVPFISKPHKCICVPFITFLKLKNYESIAREFYYIISTRSNSIISSLGKSQEIVLNKNYRIADNCFLIARDIPILTESGFLRLSIEVNITEPVIQLPNLMTLDREKCRSDFGKLLGNRQYSDVTFIVENNEIPGHKFLIATASPILCDIMEKCDKVVINGYSTKAFRKFLRFAYTSTFEYASTEIVFELIALANDYKFKSLKQFCENALKQLLNNENAIEIFEKSCRYELNEDLKKSSFKIIQELFLRIKQNMPNCFYDDPQRVVNLAKMAESLLNGLKMEDYVAQKRDLNEKAQESDKLLEETCVDLSIPNKKIEGNNEEKANDIEDEKQKLDDLNEEAQKSDKFLEKICVDLNIPNKKIEDNNEVTANDIEDEKQKEERDGKAQESDELLEETCVDLNIPNKEIEDNNEVTANDIRDEKQTEERDEKAQESDKLLEETCVDLNIPNKEIEDNNEVTANDIRDEKQTEERDEKAQESDKLMEETCVDLNIPNKEIEDNNEVTANDIEDEKQKEERNEKAQESDKLLEETCVDLNILNKEIEGNNEVTANDIEDEKQKDEICNGAGEKYFSNFINI